MLPPQLKNSALLVILGHYGSGKTNLALNLALQLKDLGRTPLLVDLDVVNPYFRSTDYSELVESNGIGITGPVYGKSNLDAPSLAPGIDSKIAEASVDAPVIVDVGGDADGVRALARFVPAINKVKNKYVMAVVNTRRLETSTVEGSMQLLLELKTASAPSIDALIGNTHLAEHTTVATITQSLSTLQELSSTSGIPLVAVTVSEELYEQTAQELSETLQKSETKLLPIKRFVKTVWQ